LGVLFECASNEGKFLKMHNPIMQHNGIPDSSNLSQIAINNRLIHNSSSLEDIENAFKEEILNK
jgi:hypothetical protein